MRKLLLLSIVLLAAPLLAVAQTQETYYFEGQMTPTKENPPVSNNSFGLGEILILINRDETGAVVNARVDFKVQAYFAQQEHLTGLHIHRNPVGVNGPVVINSGLAAAANIMGGPGETTLFFQVNITDPAIIDTALDVIADTDNYYVNLHSMTHPSGIMRGQLVQVQHEFMSHQLELQGINGIQATLDPILAAAAAVADGLAGAHAKLDAIIAEDAADDATATARFNAIETQLAAIAALQVRIAERLSIRP